MQLQEVKSYMLIAKISCQTTRLFWVTNLSEGNLSGLVIIHRLDVNSKSYLKHISHNSQHCLQNQPVKASYRQATIRKVYCCT